MDNNTTVILINAIWAIVYIVTMAMIQNKPILRSIKKKRPEAPMIEEATDDQILREFEKINQQINKIPVTQDPVFDHTED